MPQSQWDNNHLRNKSNSDDKELPADMPSTSTAIATNNNTKKRKQQPSDEKASKKQSSAKKSPQKKEKVDGFLLAAKGWAEAASAELAPYLERILKREAEEKARKERGEEIALNSPDFDLPIPKSKQRVKPPISNHHREQQKEYQRRAAAAAAQNAATVAIPNSNNQKVDNAVVQKAFKTGHNGQLAASIGIQLDKMMLASGTTTTTAAAAARPPPPPRLVPAPLSSLNHHHHHQSYTDTNKHKDTKTTFKVKVYAGTEGNGWSHYQQQDTTTHQQQQQQQQEGGRFPPPTPTPPPPQLHPAARNTTNTTTTTTTTTKFSNIFDTPPGLSLLGLGSGPNQQYHPQSVELTPFTEFLLSQNLHQKQQLHADPTGIHDNNNNRNGKEDGIDYEALDEFIDELDFSKKDHAVVLALGEQQKEEEGRGTAGGTTTVISREEERLRNDRIMRSHDEAVVAELELALPTKTTANTTPPSVVSPGLAAMLSCLPPNTNTAGSNNGTCGGMHRRTTRSSGLFSPVPEEGCGIPSTAAMFNSPGELPGLMSPSILAAHLPF